MPPIPCSTSYANACQAPSTLPLNVRPHLPLSSIPDDPSHLIPTVLARIKAFLPAISASNESLSQQKPEDIDMENVAEDEEQYIEMVRTVAFSRLPASVSLRVAVCIYAPLFTNPLRTSDLASSRRKLAPSQGHPRRALPPMRSRNRPRTQPRQSPNRIPSLPARAQKKTLITLLILLMTTQMQIRSRKRRST